MSESDKAQFISDNQELFAGESGKTLLKAFETGNYNIIESALMNNTGLAKQREELLRQVEQTLLIELAREGEDYNAAYVAQLQEYKKYLEDYNNLYKASLDNRLDQEQKALEQYKKIEESKRDAEVETLEKRKEAYQNYFDEINQAEEDQNYEEQADTLINNLAKLGASSNADAAKQAKELENSLKKLEEDRLAELRQRAQEQITQNIDDQITEINEKFDELLNNSNLLLQAFLQQTDVEALISDSISTAIATDGLTNTGLEDFLQNLKSD